MIDDAMVMAGRLAAGRSARPLFFVGDGSRDWTDRLDILGEALAIAGHLVVTLASQSTATATIEDALEEARRSGPVSRAVVLVVPALAQLERRTQAFLLDSLHLAARDRSPLGCIAFTDPGSPKRLGDLKPDCEMMVEFRNASEA